MLLRALRGPDGLPDSKLGALSNLGIFSARFMVLCWISHAECGFITCFYLKYLTHSHCECYPRDCTPACKKKADRKASP